MRLHVTMHNQWMRISDLKFMKFLSATEHAVRGSHITIGCSGWVNPRLH